MRVHEHNGEKTLHEIEDTHHSYLLSVKNNEENARASLLYSYRHSINGFAAKLTPDEAEEVQAADYKIMGIRRRLRRGTKTRLLY